MRPDHRSLTAERVAMRRAAHQLLDRPPIFDDPLAVRIAAGGNVVDFEREIERAERSPIAPYLRAFMAVRSRCAEDELAEAIGRGVRQYVILGAGLDTFAYRNPHPADALRVFEVDHPATQAWKRERLQAAGIGATGALTFVPVDFDAQLLGPALLAAGYCSDEPAFFGWLGVTPYLDTSTVMETLGFVARSPRQSGIVFDYAVSPDLLDTFQLAVFGRIAAKVAAAGEPFRSTFDPVELASQMHALGFREIDDLDEEILNARYFAGRSDRLKVGSLARVMIARV